MEQKNKNNDYVAFLSYNKEQITSLYTHLVSNEISASFNEPFTTKYDVYPEDTLIDQWSISVPRKDAQGIIYQGTSYCSKNNLDAIVCCLTNLDYIPAVQYDILAHVKSSDDDFLPN